jgi:hypothetical protein
VNLPTLKSGASLSVREALLVSDRTNLTSGVKALIRFYPEYIYIPIDQFNNLAVNNERNILALFEVVTKLFTSIGSNSSPP